MGWWIVLIVVVVGAILLFSGDGQAATGEVISDLEGTPGGFGVGALIMVVGTLALIAGAVWLVTSGWSPNSGMVPGGPAEANDLSAAVCCGGGFGIFGILGVLFMLAGLFSGGGGER